MEWTAYSVECADTDERAALVDWFDGTHPLDVPDGADHVHGPLIDADGEETPADLAWIGKYVYLLTNRPVEGVLADAAGRWERAVVAAFDGATETCEEAVLYRSEDDDPVERARYEGIPELGGQGLLYRFAMAHQFRFRVFAHAPPAPTVTPAFGAFDAVVGMGWGSDEMDSFEAETGVSPTTEGLAFLEDDPVLDEGEFYGDDGSA